MSSKKYPPLTRADVISILGALGFVLKRQGGSHAHYERAADAERGRSIVTVDLAVGEFWVDLIKSMVRQSGFSREEFYGATKRTAKKAGVVAGSGD